MARKDIVDATWLELNERDDRTSPEEYPEMCLITYEELAEFMQRTEEAAFQAGYVSAADRARAFHPTMIVDGRAHMASACAEYMEAK